MEESMVWVIMSRAIFLWSCGRRLSKMPVKGFVLLELVAMSVAACLCRLVWYVFASESLPQYIVELFTVT